MKTTHYYILPLTMYKAAGRLPRISLHVIVSLFLLVTLNSCSNRKASPSQEQQKDAEAKKMMQGIWVNESHGNCVFRVVGDTIFYPDSLSESVRFHILADTLYLENSLQTKYHIKKMSNCTFWFVNTEGDEIRLSKAGNDEYDDLFERKELKNVAINQGGLIKRDSVLLVGDTRYHAYSQVNPTTYKVLRQSINDEGVTVDQAYFDNIVHIAVYVGSKPLLSRDYRKTDFTSLVPAEYIARCILSDISIEKADDKGVHFTAILTEPDTFTSYQINLIIDKNGKTSMSI